MCIYIYIYTLYIYMYIYISLSLSIYIYIYRPGGRSPLGIRAGMGRASNVQSLCGLV